jgi:aryl-alcohol dehydrogenase-like predicted oxidoreductase
LQTDVIDLYQVHWPDRPTNYFGQLGYRHAAQDNSVPIAETLGVLGDLVQAGKVRHIGVSNETPWGLMRYLEIAERQSLPRPVSIQNPYNLLNRTFDIGLAEIAHRENCGLLAYSPLAFGVLSGKYLHGASPAGARLSLFERFNRYSNPQGTAATQAYVALAQRHGLDPARMALAWVNQQAFVSTTIIGATTLEQLDSNLLSLDLQLNDDLLEEIENIHQQIPNPCP